MSIKAFMVHKHKECDLFFSQAENAVIENDWVNASTQWQAFYDELEEHLHMEEGVLFPQFEEATGMTQGPTQVMRMEHVQMRSLCVKLNQAISSQNKDAYLGNAETLMILMQQHNMKEEQMLYPMADRVLPDTGSILDLMSDYES
jgi:hemerythrin-like domain-containing protein